MDRQKVWVDGERCTGCGVCIEVCSDGAITLVHGTACVAEGACSGCGACLDACPVAAIQPVIQGEIVPVSGRRPPVPYQPAPLAKGAGTVVAVAGAGLLMRAAGALVRTAGRLLTRPPVRIRLFRRPAQDFAARAPSRAGGRVGRAHRARRRKRGQ